MTTANVGLEVPLNTLCSPKIEIKILNEAFVEKFGLPEYASKEAAAIDIRAAVDSDVFLWNGETKIIPTGFAVDLDNPWSVMFLLPRSGMGVKKGIVLGNLVGCIDSDFQGEVGVPLWNRSKEGDPHIIQRGDRICQAILLPVLRGDFIKVTEFSRKTERGEGGFGSTGGK